MLLNDVMVMNLNWKESTLVWLSLPPDDTQNGINGFHEIHETGDL